MTLDGEQIRALVSEVADELDATGGDAHTIIVVGGSLLAWRGLREATEDVDSIRRLDDELRRAVGVVAARHDLSVGWLNDHATAFAPQGLDVDACDVLLDRPRLRVLGAPMRAVFLMKLNRSLPQDLEDMRSVRRSPPRPTTNTSHASSSTNSPKVATTLHWNEPPTAQQALPSAVRIAR